MGRNDADKEGFAIISLMIDVKEERMWGQLSPLNHVDVELSNVPIPTFAPDRIKRVKRSLKSFGHIKEWEKIAKPLNIMKREKSNGIQKRSPNICGKTSSCKKMRLIPTTTASIPITICRLIIIHHHYP